MRKNRRNQAEQPAQPTAAAPAPSAPDTDLQALRERLEALEKAQAPDATWHPLDRHRHEQARWIAANTRTDHADRCPACGVAGGEQRRTSSDVMVLPSAWLCVGCSEAVEIGWGTNHRIMPNWGACLDRLTARVAGQDEPTAGLRALAGRYGLKFALARDTAGGDGTAWSHLGDLAKWREVGAKAARRAAAGFGVFPAANAAALQVETEMRHVYDPSSPAGRSMRVVDVEPEQPTPDELAAQLRLEEDAIEQALKDQVRRAKEQEAQAEQERRKAEIRAHYREHRAELEQQIERSRAQLRGDLTAALTAHAERGL